MKKRIISLIILLIICTSNIIIFADDEIEEYNKKIDNNEINKTIETSANLNDEPKINSRSAVVIDRKSKNIIYGKNENVKKAMASTTKIMTAMVVIQNTNLNNIVDISKKAAGTGGSRLGLKAGDKITVKDLLYGLLLRSGNDCAVALAEYVAGSVPEFSNLMNQNAQMLGLNNTHFVTPHGLDEEEHYTTAYELAILADYALNNEVFAQIVNTKSYTININKNSKTLNNTNELLGNLKGVYGVKTGFTNGAGRCLVTSIKRGNLDVICVVLGADTKKDRTRDSAKLIEYTFNKYEEIDIKEKIKENFEKWNEINGNRINIEKGESSKLELTLNDKDKIFTYPIEKGTEDNINIEINANLNLKAPVLENTNIGKIKVYYNAKELLEIDILNINKINKKRIKNYMSDIFKNYDNYLEGIFESY